MSQRPRKPGRPPPDAELFRALVADVTPLPRARRAVIERPRPQPVPTQRLRDEQAALRESLSGEDAWALGLETGEELCYARPGVSPQTLRKLRRGHWLIQDELDLHGMTAPEARQVLAAFLNQCVWVGVRCVRIIHGKGLRSRNREPVLKRKVALWLAQCDEVLAYCQARPTEGGGGAVVALLKGGTPKAAG
jgi:DNA-nicking Smr family endonuclease